MPGGRTGIGGAGGIASVEAAGCAAGSCCAALGCAATCEYCSTSRLAGGTGWSTGPGEGRRTLGAVVVETCSDVVSRDEAIESALEDEEALQRASLARSMGWRIRCSAEDDLAVEEDVLARLAS